MLISDVIMTGMTGIEAAIIAREKFPKCKILLFSGQAATADLLEVARAQGHEFEILAKPVHPTDFAGKVARLIFSDFFSVGAGSVCMTLPVFHFNRGYARVNSPGFKVAGGNRA